MLVDIRRSEQKLRKNSMKKHSWLMLQNFLGKRVASVTDDIDSVVKTWSYLFSSIIEKYSPIRYIRGSDRNCPWVNSEVKAMEGSRYRLKKAAVSAKSNTLMHSYREARDKVNSLNISLNRNHTTMKNPNIVEISRKLER